MSKHLPQIALLIESSRNYGRGVLRGIARYAHAHGPWSFFVQERELHSGIPNWLQNWKGDGVIARIENRGMAAELLKLDCPVVDVLGSFRFQGMPAFDTDAMAVAKMAADFLLRAGFKHFAFSGYQEVPFSDRRAAAFAKYLSENGKSELALLAAPAGKLSSLGSISASLAKAPAPCKLTVTVGLTGTKVSNGWDIWVYPDEAAPPPPANIVVSTAWDEATKAALADGKTVLLLPAKKLNYNSLRGSFLPTFWSPVWFPQQQPDTMGILCDPKHPLFARFPTDFYGDWQWYDLMQNSRPMILDDTPADFRPLVQVIDNFARNHKLGTVFEAHVGRGIMLVCSIDITSRLESRPAARQFAKSIYAYVGSAAFNPKAELNTNTLDQLFVPEIANRLQALGAKVHADSQASEEYDGSQAIDGDADTMWHTPWEGAAPDFPHELVVELPQSITLAGIKCLPRQDGNQNGWIKDFAVFTSDDKQNWGAAAVQGAFPQDAQWHTVKFATPVKARYLKLVANSSFDSSKPYASLAELDLLPVDK
jgi:F5/8 type C domain